MITQITLNDGETVKVKPKISIHALRKFQSEGLLPKSLLQAFVGADKEPDKMEPYLINAAWLAYVNGNPGTTMTQEQFEDKLDLNFELFGKILVDMIGNVAESDNKLASSFKRSTKKGSRKDKRKRHQN